jgi:hypothetical protein
MHLKDYVICHGNPFEVFKGWCPFKMREWHTHPLPNSPDHIVTLHLTSAGVRDEIEGLEAAGVVTRLPTLHSGNKVSEHHVKHPAFRAAGVTVDDRTWDAATKLHRHLAWPPLHPDR